MSSSLDSLLCSASSDVFTGTGSLTPFVQELWPIITSRVTIGARAGLRGSANTNFLFISSSKFVNEGVYNRVKSTRFSICFRGINRLHRPKRRGRVVSVGVLGRKR